jgi:hypothetical protein
MKLIVGCVSKTLRRLSSQAGYWHFGPSWQHSASVTLRALLSSSGGCYALISRQS